MEKWPEKGKTSNTRIQHWVAGVCEVVGRGMSWKTNIIFKVFHKSRVHFSDLITHGCLHRQARVYIRSSKSQQCIKAFLTPMKTKLPRIRIRILFIVLIHIISLYSKGSYYAYKWLVVKLCCFSVDDMLTSPQPCPNTCLIAQTLVLNICLY